MLITQLSCTWPEPKLHTNFSKANYSHLVQLVYNTVACGLQISNLQSNVQATVLLERSMENFRRLKYVTTKKTPVLKFVTIIVCFV